MRVEGTKLPHFPPISEVDVHGTEKMSDFRSGVTTTLLMYKMPLFVTLYQHVITGMCSIDSICVFRYKNVNISIVLWGDNTWNIYLLPLI